MTFFKRLSDGFWSYVSPRKANSAAATPLPTPQTDPPAFQKPAIPRLSPMKRRSSLSASIRDISRHARSMSPGERIGNWRVRSSSSQASSKFVGGKRKREYAIESPSAGRMGKLRRVDRDSSANHGYDDYIDQQTVLHEDDDSRATSSLRHASGSPRFPRYKSPTLDEYAEEEDATSVGNTLVVSENQEYTPATRRVVDIPEESALPNIDEDELRAKGYDDDYISLIRRIALRGHEPLLPSFLRLDHKFFPDALFEETDDAFITSVRGEHFKAGKALDRLIDLGGRVRDRIETQSKVAPEQQVKRHMEKYIKWAMEDAGFDDRTRIPILAMEFQPAGTEAAILKANALKKCKRLASRYREALRVKQSVEFSPVSLSSRSTLLSCPLPTFYALVASHQVVAIMAYRPDSEIQELNPMAFFNFKERNYDVWNALALAILVNHVRNVHQRIADETGLGLKEGLSDDEIDRMASDPDA
ncbi:Hypothetical predicted protein [Lecanosticta acicola]|uniref:Uncharacterized protein n=1 Tax=Lecanosticta acicola TaxID=111012 RepID=A0AAI9EAC6_9PEZI|nr:Hypothetical predicted protein [Lecanosticta acicola]